MGGNGFVILGWTMWTMWTSGRCGLEIPTIHPMPHAGPLFPIIGGAKRLPQL